MPQDLAGVARTNTTNAAVVKMAQFLQTLYSVGDASNGITIYAISESKVTGIAAGNLEDGSGSGDTIANAFNDTGDAALVSVNEATAHLNKTTATTEGLTTGTDIAGTLAEVMANIALLQWFNSIG